MATTTPDPLVQEEREDHLAQLSPARLRELLRLSQAFNSTVDIDELLPRILDAMNETIESEAGSLWIVEGEALVCRAAVGPVAEQLEGLELPLGAGIVGDCVAQRRPVLVADPRSDPRFLHQIDDATGYVTRCVLAVPLVADGVAVGAIQVLNDRSGAFDQEDLHFLTAAADDAAAALRNARLFEAEKRARDLHALLDLSHEITSTFDLDRITLSLVNLAGKAVPFDRCVLALHEGDDVQVRAISGEEKVDRKAPAVRDTERFLHWAAARGTALRVPDVTDTEDEVAPQLVERFASYLQKHAVGGLLVLPINDADGALGSLLFEFHRPHAFDDWQAEAAQLLANEAALALRNAQLYADVPFISWLEPLREKRKALALLPAATWTRYALLGLVVLGVLTFVRVPLPVSGREATLRAAVQRAARSQVNGVIESMQVREGDRVQAGDVLARVRDDGLLRELAEARGAHALSVRQALSDEARGDGGAASLARVRADELQNVIALLAARLAEADVVAPEPGRVLTPRPEELVGAFTVAGAPVLWIGDPDWVELELLVSQEDVGAVRIGDRVRARATSHPGVTFAGQVAAVAPGAQQLNGRPVYAVRALLDNREGLLLPGMSVRARVHTRARPVGAVVFRRPARWLNMNLWW
jgi:GAF domain-containing protein/multidrug resistance efflux pump